MRVKIANTLSIGAALLTAFVISQPVVFAQGYTPTGGTAGQVGGMGQGQGQCGGKHHRHRHHRHRGGRMGGLNGQGGAMPMQGGQAGSMPMQGGVPGQP
jgi:hypothetical protein